PSEPAVAHQSWTGQGGGDHDVPVHHTHQLRARAELTAAVNHTSARPTTRTLMSVDLASLGWDHHFASLYRPYAYPCQRPARVSRVDRGACVVLGADGATRASIGGALLASAGHDPVRLPCAGDWVVVRHWPDERRTVEAVLTRRTAIVRASAGAESTAQVLAANVDVAAVVAPVDPEPDIGMVERLVSLAWASGARPVVLLTKADLAADPGS